MSVNTLLNEHIQFLTDITNNPNRYMDFLHAMAKFHKYPLIQQINLYLHAPAATPAVASKYIINDVLHWKLNDDAPAIEILNPTAENAIEQVYDIRNTKYYQELPNKDLSQIIWQYNPKMHYPIFNELFPGRGEISERVLDILTAEAYNKYADSVEDSELLALSSTYIILERLGYNAEAELGMQFIMHPWQDFNASKLLSRARILADEKLKIIESYIKTSNFEKEQEHDQNEGSRDREHLFGGMGLRQDEISTEPEASILAGNAQSGDSPKVPGAVSGGLPREIRTSTDSDYENKTDSRGAAPRDELAGISESNDDGSRNSQRDAAEGDLRDGLAPQDISLADFNFTADMSSTAGKRDVLKINLAAIKLVKKLEAENRAALPNERELLKNYRGFGGIPEAFDEFNTAWKSEYADLRETLTQQEFHAARDSVLNAHYTSPEIIQAIYSAIKQMGFNGGNILEPAVGSGRFFEEMPKEIKDNSHLVGIELDTISSKIAAYAQPEAQILNKGFEENSFANDSFDLAISNVPFGDYKIKSDLAYRDKSMLIHDYFIAKMIDQVRPGGIVAAITSSGTMDKDDTKARTYMTDKADIVGAFRLPTSAFKSAGTDVTTDIIFFRKKDPANELSFDASRDNAAFCNKPMGSMNVNTYYSYDVHPDHIIGDMNLRAGKFGTESFCEDTLDRPVHEALKEAIAKDIPQGIYTAKPNMPIPVENVKPTENATGFFYENGDILRYDGNGNKVRLELAPNEVQHLLAALHIRDAARELIEGQRNYCSNEELATLQKKLSRTYDDYVDKYGRIQLDNKLKKLMESEPSYPLLRSLEVFDHKVFSRKADMFYHRTINPDAHPSYAETNEDALKLSMNYQGGVDIEYMAQLTGSSKNEIIEDMEFSSIYYDPVSENYQLADEYLSGDIANKIEQAEEAIKKLQLKQQDLAIEAIYPDWNKFEFTPQNPIEEKIYNHVMSGGTLNRLPKECFEYLHQQYDNLQLMALALDKWFIAIPRESEEKNHNKLRIELLNFKLNQVLDSDYFSLVISKIAPNTDIRSYFLYDKSQELGGNKEYAAVIYKYLEKKMDDWPDDEIHNKFSIGIYLRNSEKKSFMNTETADFDQFMQEYSDKKASFVKSDPNYQNIEKRIQKLQKNITALKKAKPTELKPGEISVRLGSTWLDPKYIKEFLVEEMEIPAYEANLLTVEFSKETGEWRIGRRSVGEYNTKINDVYGTPERNALELCELALNLKEASVYNTVYVNGKEKRRINPKATMTVRIKQQSIKDAFQKWLWTDSKRSKEVCDYYNRHFNNIKPREYNGDFLTFPGMSSDITMQKHQRDAIAHTLYGGNTLLAHCVGAGKSFEMIASAMESKRLGLAKKPMLIVPKHLTEQMGEDFHRLYPDAKVLIASDKTFTAQNRKEFCSKIATQNWDAVIMGYTQFEKVPLSIERQKITLQEQINEIAEAAEQYAKQIGHNRNSFTVKQMAKMRKKLEAKLASLQKAGKDETVTFEDLGVDKLYVDEAHYFKNLYTPTKLGNIPGIQTTEAAKTMDFYQKCKYINEITNYRGLVFATGTPISNSMTEMYTMQRYLQPQRLAENGMSYFDAWAANFGEQVTDVEINPEGKGFRERTKFSQFQNLPELMATFKEIADIKTADMLNLPVPKEEIIVEKIKPSPLQKSYVNQLADRAEDVRAGSVDTSEDNMLKITNEGRLLALDQRIIIPNAPDNPESKTNRCIQNVIKIYHEGMDSKATQLIFCDKSTPNKEGKFNVYDDIKEKLIQQGIPAKEIAFIHDAQTDKQKDELFDKVRQGNVRILLGSTDKLGVGTNIQDRLAATHDLDVPWRPSDLEQRKGRICRRGNQNKSVKIFRYVTEGTFDAYMWQILENKQRFISQIMTSKAPSRTSEDCDEVTLSYAEVKACATGNPLIKEKMELDNEIKRLEIAKSNYLTSHESLQHKCDFEYPIQIKSLESLIEKMQDMKSQVDNNTIKVEDKAGHQKELFSLELNDKQYINPIEANAAIIAASKGEIQKVAGRYKGLALLLERDALTNDIKIVLSRQNRRECLLVMDNEKGNILAMNKILNSLSDDIKHQKNRLESLKKDCETIKQELEKPFDKEEILQEKLRRRQALELESQIAMEGNTEITRRIQVLENVLDSNGNILPSKLPEDELSAACTAHAAYIYKSNDHNWPEDGNSRLFTRLAEQYEATTVSHNKFDAFEIQEMIQDISPNMPTPEEMANIMDKYYGSERKIAMADYSMETKRYNSMGMTYAR